MTRIAMLVLALCLAAPAGLAAPKKKNPKVKKKPEAVVLVESLFHPSHAEPGSRAKVFLVAGSSLASSFAREVADQRELWRKAGLADDEIECYYIVPLQEDFNGDAAQFKDVAPLLSSCHPASVKLLRRHLREAIARKPPYLYLYVTSHGDKPTPLSAAEAKPKDDDYWALTREAKVPAFNQYSMLVEGMPDGTATAPEIYGALRAGVDPADLYLTPRYLRDALSQGAGVPKFVVLQGCFSGGFIEEEEKPYTDDLLTSLPSLTVLTAARYDRSSFGCEPGSRTTFYGGAYNAQLARYMRQDPRLMDWKALHDSVEREVARLEKREKVSPPSIPRYFSNFLPTSR